MLVCVLFYSTYVYLPTTLTSVSYTHICMLQYLGQYLVSLKLKFGQREVESSATTTDPRDRVPGHFPCAASPPAVTLHCPFHPKAQAGANVTAGKQKAQCAAARRAGSSALRRPAGYQQSAAPVRGPAGAEWTRVPAASPACAASPCRRAARTAARRGYSRRGWVRGWLRSRRATPGGRRAGRSWSAPGSRRRPGPSPGAPSGAGGRRPRGARTSTCCSQAAAAPPSRSGDAAATPGGHGGQAPRFGSALRSPLPFTVGNGPRLDLRENFPAFRPLRIGRRWGARSVRSPGPAPWATCECVMTRGCRTVSGRDLPAAAAGLLGTRRPAGLRLGCRRL